jgi:hypothetical protein
VYGGVCELVRVALPEAVSVELDVVEGGMDSVSVNEPQEVEVLVETSDKLGVRIPVGDKVTTGEGVTCVDGVKPSEGVA